MHTATQTVPHGEVEFSSVALYKRRLSHAAGDSVGTRRAPRKGLKGDD